MATFSLAFRWHFGNLRDPRRFAGKTRYRFLDLIFISVCGIIAGADDWHGIATFACKRRSWLQQFCQLPDEDNPSHDTFERLFRRLDSQAFARCFGHWTAALAQGLSLKQIAIDGKTLCGSARNGLRALHLVSAWATHNHLSLGQVAVSSKSNEITAIPKLLEILELNGALVTIDAIGCQKKIAKQVVDQDGDYVLVVKDNQPRLREEVVAAITAAAEQDFKGVRHDLFTTQERGHGRVEKRDYIVLYDLEMIKEQPKWANLTVVGLCIREREVKGKKSVEKHYFIGSRLMPAKEYGEALRGHWRIENNLHWQLDVTFAEDANRVADRNAAENMALLRRMALNLLKRHKGKDSIKNKRYQATLDVSVLDEILNCR
jgi:predicted transposase YbfD/YdcC